ncbi:Hemopexin family protein [Coccidioides posadasii C735 delta SOWgp]|uniref:Hemopexin family protein n=1 Tax=Coccidioides posadasii (strain C735) TaxID=222929 RepID=C5PEX5_COCP7|nr:Hemopexin family protein [Coccidioides posadasii C735 delta SOWgp]EER23193.1 Hemopexin family protein [Coccidioides posadasii C735 delta SOWgp]|eukprot:XP_003065338.1 Hemopexin family protein [Coccidioides posadasii C735 delta SOWgp]
MSVSINAALRVPGHQGEGYFFKGQRYLRMWWKPGTPEERKVFGPAKITDEWKIIRDAGFTSVDAMLPSTNDPQKVYAFSGNRYVRFSFVPGTPQESKIFGPAKIVDEWKSLRDAGFEKVDAVIPIPSTKKEEYEEEAYFFSGTQYIANTDVEVYGFRGTKYVRFRFTPGTPKEEVIFGPAGISENWATLREL